MVKKNVPYFKLCLIKEVLTSIVAEVTVTAAMTAKTAVNIWVDPIFMSPMTTLQKFFKSPNLFHKKVEIFLKSNFYLVLTVININFNIMKKNSGFLMQAF